MNCGVFAPVRSGLTGNGGWGRMAVSVVGVMGIVTRSVRIARTLNRERERDGTGRCPSALLCALAELVRPFQWPWQASKKDPEKGEETAVHQTSRHHLQP